LLLKKGYYSKAVAPLSHQITRDPVKEPPEWGRVTETLSRDIETGCDGFIRKHFDLEPLSRSIWKILEKGLTKVFIIHAIVLAHSQTLSIVFVSYTLLEIQVSAIILK